MKIENNAISINNTKNEWSLAFEYIYDKTNVGKKMIINVRINEKNNFQNLIYYLILEHNNPNISMVIIDEMIDDTEDVYFELGVLFYLVSEEVKDKIKYIKEIREIEKSIPKHYDDTKKLNFYKTLPFIIFNENNIMELNKLYESTEDETILNCCSSNDANKFIRSFIQTSINKDNMYNDFIEQVSKELNIFSLFLLIYNIMSKEEKTTNEPLNAGELQDIKLEIRNFCGGLYQIVENSCFHSSGKYAICYFSKLIIKSQNTNKLKTTIDYYLTSHEKKVSYLENYNFFIKNETNIFAICIDDITNVDSKLNNMVDVYNKTNQTEISTLKELFEKLYKSESENLKSVFTKYGIKSFINSTEILDMQVLVNSGEQGILINNKNIINTNEKIIDSETMKNSYVTEYAMLMPFKTIERSEKEQASIITRDMISSELKYEILDITEIFDKHYEEYSDAKTKGKIISDIYEEIIIEKEKTANKIVLNLDYKKEYNVELLVKIIAKLINYIFSKNEAIYLIVKFIKMNNETIYNKLAEFFNFWSLFSPRIKKLYEENDKENKIEDMQSDFQIGFFYENKYISTMVGTDYNIAVQSFINNLLYENINDDFDKFDLYINQLSDGSKNKLKTLNIFPFDLIIKENDESLFINYFKNKLLNDKYIYHKNMNVLLGSGLHLDCFYDASNLFLNNYFVKRVAYYIKNDLIEELKKEENKGKKIVLVGYAPYSHMLCEEIYEMLKKELKLTKKDIGKLIVSNVGDLTVDGNYVDYDKNSFVTFILPIGSTLNTFFKMNLALGRYWKSLEINKFYSNRNYCVIAVSDKNNYWKIIENNSQKLVFQDVVFTDKKIDEKTEEEKIQFKILFEAKAKFLDDKSNLSVTHVDKTSTLLNTIYKPEVEKNIGDPDIKKFKILQKNIKYGHYLSNNNHHLFYINFKAILRDETNCKEIEKYFNMKMQNEIDPLAYNIIVSPLHISNDKFLRMIIKGVFKNNASLIQFDPKNNYRENFIYKYEYIKDRINKIYEKSKNTKINIYFIDNTIISGKTFLRAKELISALLDTIKYKNRIDKRVFTKAILLINRMSNNSLNSLMENYENVISYLDIKCPNFDMSLGQCPDCKITQNYLKLSEITVDPELKILYLEKAKKHEVIPVSSIREDEYNDYDYFRLYFTHCVLLQKNKIHEFYNDIRSKDDEYNKCHEFISEIFEQIYHEVGNAKSNDKEELKNIFIKIISRPNATLYENLKQVFLKFLIVELENAIKENNNLEYIMLLVTRISYFGSMYLNVNKEKLEDVFKNSEKSTKLELKKSINWEEMYNRGIIK